MVKPNIIGVMGFKSSGKDTLARQLIQHGYQKFAFADTLKDVLSVVFGWNRNLLEGDSNISREWRELPDEWWEEKLNWFSEENQIIKSLFPRFTPRVAMQMIGTDLFRKHFNDSIWILSLENKIKKIPNVIISDCRFPNEIKMIKDNGGYLIRVKRGPEPDWYPVGIDAANGNSSAIDYLLSKQIHMSEWSWLNQNFDLEVSNDESPEAMFEVVKKKLKL